MKGCGEINNRRDAEGQRDPHSAWAQRDQPQRLTSRTSTADRRDDEAVMHTDMSDERWKRKELNSWPAAAFYTLNWKYGENDARNNTGLIKYVIFKYRLHAY